MPTTSRSSLSLRTTRTVPVRALLGALGVAAAATSCAPPDADPVSERAAPLVRTASSGGYNYRLFIPSSYSPGTPAPLVLMLHGCTQSADQFAQATQMEALAETEGFLVAFPDQPASANPVKCWRWFDTAHQARGGGEPAILAGIVEHVGKSYRIDSDRVYAAGFSAGAGTAVILGATYPDVFAAIAVSSGLEYKAATDAFSASSAMRGGGPSPVTQGGVALRAMGANSRVVPTLVFHGTGDTTVAPLNAEQVVSQWAQTNDLADDGRDNDSIDDRPESTEARTAPGGRRYTRSVYRDSSGVQVLEKILVEGMNHAWSGTTGGAYTDSKGPNETALVWDFFRTHPRSGSVRPDGGTTDGGTTDGGAHDGGTTDGGTHDGGTTDGGTDGGAARTLVLPSIDAEDGTVGALPIDPANTAVLQVGDRGLFNSDSFRGVLSFDTSLLPAGAAVKSARLLVYRKALAGSVSALLLDVQRGVIGRSAALLSEDYGAAVTQPGVATAAPPSADDAVLEIPLPTGALAAISPGGRTQLRLRAVSPRDFTADLLTLHDGSAGARAPRLVLTY